MAAEISGRGAEVQGEFTVALCRWPLLLCYHCQGTRVCLGRDGGVKAQIAPHSAVVLADELPVYLTWSGAASSGPFICILGHQLRTGG